MIQMIKTCGERERELASMHCIHMCQPWVVAPSQPGGGGRAVTVFVGEDREETEGSSSAKLELLGICC